MALYLEVAILYCRVRGHKDIRLLNSHISEEEPHYNFKINLRNEHIIRPGSGLT